MELGGEVFSHGNEGFATPRTQASTLIDIGGYYHFKNHPRQQFLFCYGHSVAGQTEQYAYVGLYWTWGKSEKKSDSSGLWLPGADVLAGIPTGPLTRRVTLSKGGRN